MNDDLTKAQGLIERGKVAEGLELLERTAASGDTEAQFQFGVIYYSGVHVPADLEIARQWFDKADDGDHIKAPYFIGRIFTKCAEQKVTPAGPSKGKSRDEIAKEWHQAAFGWYEESAERGYRPAITRLGVNYLKGIGTERNWDKAYEYLGQAKAAGNYVARSQMAWMLIRGYKGFSGISVGIYELSNTLFSIVRDYGKTYETKEEYEELTRM